MKNKAKTRTADTRDPFPYDGPIERADGRRPFNRYLWPTEQWVAYNSGSNLLRRVDFTYRVEVIALADGRWSTDGSVTAIEQNAATCSDGPCVFATRSQAVRTSAARMIRAARRNRTAPAYNPHAPILSEEACAAVIQWAREVVARETGKEPPRPIRLRPIPKPRAKTGLPLFDMETPDA